MCHMPCVMRHVSCVMSHLSPVINIQYSAGHLDITLAAAAGDLVINRVKNLFSIAIFLLLLVLSPAIKGRTSLTRILHPSPKKSYTKHNAFRWASSRVPLPSLFQQAKMIHGHLSVGRISLFGLGLRNWERQTSDKRQTNIATYYRLKPFKIF